MRELLVISKETGPRLQYVLNWLLSDVLQVPWRMITNADEVPSDTKCLSYGATVDGSFSVPVEGLLSETGIRKLDPPTGYWNSIPVLFPDEGEHDLKFDLFSAIFFLLSRYEEYHSYLPDKHDRYRHTESLLFRKGWLKLPLIDLWIQAFKEKLEMYLGDKIPDAVFSFTPTYDIDIAWSYRNKPFSRLAGGLFRDLIGGRLSHVKLRLSVHLQLANDPFDCFSRLHVLHQQAGVHPVYFMLVAGKPSEFDRNNQPQSRAMMSLMRELAANGTMGIHPSYFAERDQLIRKEIRFLEQAVEKEMRKSRQHYIRMRLPDTYHALMDAGIREDYSMGYGTYNGFRAGTGRSFLWYDLSREKITGLLIHPFSFMDSTARFEEGLSADEAFRQLNQLESELKRLGSQLITVFHNFSLGTDPEWKGWFENYAAFMGKNSPFDIR